MADAPLPLEGGYDLQLDEYSSKAARRVWNLLVDPAGQNRSRPGIATFSRAAPAANGSILIFWSSDGALPTDIIGMTAYRDRVVAVDINRRVYSFTSDGTCTDGTDVPLGGTLRPRFLVDQGGDLLIFGGGDVLAMGQDFRTKKWYSAGSYAPQASHGIVVDRFLLLNNVSDDRVYYADVSDHTLFDQGLDIRAGASSDKLIAMMSFRNQAYLFGENSVEIWYGTGIGGDPFHLEVEVPSSLAARDSVVSNQDTLFWLDALRRVVALDGHTTDVVSTPVQRQLDAMSRVDDCIATHVLIGGRRLLAFQFPSEGTTLVYDYELKTWTEWNLYDGVSHTAFPLNAYCYQPEWARHFIGAASGYVRELSFTAYTDLGNPIDRQRILPFVDRQAPDKRKAAHYYEFSFEGGVASDFETDDETGDPHLEFRMRDEDRNWSGWKRRSLGQIGKKHITKRAGFQGSYRRRQLHIRCTAPVYFCLAGLTEHFTLRDQE